MQARVNHWLGWHRTLHRCATDDHRYEMLRGRSFRADQRSSRETTSGRPIAVHRKGQPQRRLAFLTLTVRVRELLPGS